MIHHCFGASDQVGGAQTYIKSLLKQQSGRVSRRIISLSEESDQSQFELLHLHEPKQLLALAEECPAVISLHNHSPYCPSGTQYFSTHQSCCDRPMSSLGCAWGHMVDGCGSRRPPVILQNLKTSQQEIINLKQKQILVIANSNYMRDRLIRQGLSPDQVITLYLGTEIPEKVATNLTSEIHGAQRILFVGRIVPTKGLEWLLRSMVLLNPSIHLDIAGEGWFRPKVELLAKKLGVESRITWHGWCASAQLDALYQQCFAVVFPSIWPEPAGLITLEAYTHSRPIIASAVGGIPEHIIHKKTGVLVESNNAKQLAKTIGSLANDYQTCLQIGTQGRIYHQQRFTLLMHARKLDEIYEKAIESFTKRKPC